MKNINEYINNWRIWFVGSHLAKRYHKLKHEVIGIDNCVGGYEDNLQDVKVYKIDCCDNNLVDNIFKKYNFDLVIHAACTPYEGLSIVSPLLVTRNTFDATISILSSSIKYSVKRFVFELYG